ncbi:MAG: tRNA pseudouridine(38-40) synthase TruA [Acidobacteriota bacterium]|nr:tRNA pseudouridine(38-40) synthase TruA [Acidobacteriota bacterium]
MRRIKIAVAYDGTDFHGWQVQPGLATIQGTLEEILHRIEGRPVSVAGSGRTDAGVHAQAQVAAFSLENPIPTENLRRAINRLLPASIRVVAAEERDLEFHPRFAAVAKTYEYRIARGPVCSPFDWRYVHHFPYRLDTRAMIRLARLLEGEHDFSAYAASDDSDAQGKSKVRRVFSSRLEENEDRLIYSVRGSGFLKHMVRNIMGTLLEAGKGNLDESDFAQRLNPGNPNKAGPTAPAKGLTLVSVEYRS